MRFMPQNFQVSEIPELVMNIIEAGINKEWDKRKFVRYINRGPEKILRNSGLDLHFTFHRHEALFYRGL